jgi:molecular chaperone GrpE (heat shock protein)
MATQKKNLKDVFKGYAKKREGTFQEATGGGTPIPKGEKLKDHPEAHRVQQPRDDDGQFTYNAVNNKPLKYGPSRGTTIPPLLAGMKINFANKKKDAVVLDGLTYVSGLDFTKEELMKMLEDYSIENYTENGEEKSRVVWNNLPDSEMARKKGRKSQVEKDMIAKGEDGYAPADTAIMSGRNKKPNFVNKKPPMPPANGGGNSNPPQSSQQPQIDTELAKSNPVEFGKKYQKEISNIKKLDPKISEAKIINAFASGKIQSFDDLEHALNLKNNKK